MDFVKAAERILSIDSSPNVGTDYVVDFAQDLSAELNLKSEVFATTIDGVEQKSILVRKGKPSQSELVLWSNLDTLDPGSYSLWKETDHNPFLSTIKGERIYGLGAATGKLDFLIKLKALADSSSEGQQMSPLVVGSFGKEDNFAGARHFLSQYKNNIHCVVVGEPTDLRIVNQFTGSVIVKMDFAFTEDEKKLRQKMFSDEPTATQTKIFRGRSCHASSPQFGKNAFLDLVDYITKLPSNTLLLGIDAGTSPQLLPEEAVLEMDVGINGVDSVKERFVGFLKKLDQVFKDRFSRYVKRYDLKDFPAYNIGFVRTHSDGIEMEGVFFLTEGVSKERVRDWLQSVQEPGLSISLSAFKPATKMSMENDLISLLQTILKETSLSGELTRRHKSSDASYFQLKGIPAIAFGAGALEGSSHLPNEYNLLSQLNASKEIYLKLIERLCI